jgi:predicted RNA-binding protein (virulence factor B family)
MIKIGQFNQLVIIKKVPFGVYLDGGNLGEILLPNKYLPSNAKIKDKLNVFIYFDSEDKLIATTKNPHATLNNCAFLKVIDVNRIGAFLDWGLDKDLLVPKPEQHYPMEIGQSYLVYVKHDQQGRIIASSKLDYFLNKLPPNFAPSEAVNLLIAQTSLIGTKVIINNSHWGLIHHTDIFQTLSYGKTMKGYIKTIRDDGKIDVVLRKIGRESIDDLADNILAELHKNGGFLALHDKSPSHDIQKTFNESKKSFKSAIGQLYKQGKITIESDGIYIVR